MLKIIYAGPDSVKAKKDVLEAFDYLHDLFAIKVFNVVVRIYENRAEFDRHLKRRTADWLVANASDDGEIDILSPLAMERESSHDKNEFLPILKHEFAHLFVNRQTGGSAVPMWLNEGIASYVAKQHQNEKQSLYIEENFCKKLSSSKSWNNHVNYSAYTIAALFVNFLIKKYSFLKIKELLTSLNKNYYYPSFKEIFFKVYGKDLNEMEILFTKEINK